jgi:hypothetical protein
MKNGEQIISNPEHAAGVLLENAASRRASAHPLPGPLTQAFCSGPIEVAGKTVHKVYPRTFQALAAVGSPLIGMIQDVIQGGKVDTEMSDKDLWNVCWIFTHTPPEVRQMIVNGVNAIPEAAETEIGDGWDASVINLVWMGCMEQIKRHISTMLKFSAEAQEKGEITFFQDSATPPQME